MTCKSAEVPTGELCVKGLVSGYGDMAVLHGVNLRVKRGEVVGIIGRNGMGKTTLVHTIAGFLPAKEGSVVIGGSSVLGLRPDQVARLGIGLVPQGRRVFGSLSVAEHLRLAASLGRRSHRRRSPQRSSEAAWSIERIYEDFSGLAARRGLKASQLSGGEQQMLAIARALLLDPTFLLLDEPSEGLAPAVVDDVTRVVKSLAQTDLGIIFVEQNLPAVVGIADRLAVMVRGEVAYEGTTAELSTDPSRMQELLGIG